MNRASNLCQNQRRMKFSRLVTFHFFIFWALAGHTKATFTTYNLGLAHGFVPLAKERLPYLADALATFPTDVLCLQEVWTEEDRQIITEALQSSFPYQFATPIENIKSDKRPVCLPGELLAEDKFVRCMLSHCFKLKGDEFTQCILQTCGTALDELKNENPQCATALMAQVGKSPLSALLTVLNPFARANLFAYEGSNGLMLLSKHPLEDISFLDMTDISTLNRRGALIANVEINNHPYQVSCTHLTSRHPDVPYTGNLEGWGEENKMQLTRLLEETSNTLPAVLMGDFNCGLSSSQFALDAELENSCRLPLNHGFKDPLVESNPECTYCSEAINTLNKGTSKNELIDHIYIKGASAFSSEVVFKEKITVQTEEGDEQLTNLSDHFGVRVKVK